MFLGEVSENQITFVVAKTKQKKGTSTDNDVIVRNILIVYLLTQGYLILQR